MKGFIFWFIKLGKLKIFLIIITAVFFSCLKKSNDKLNFNDKPDNKLTSLTEIIIEKTWAQQPNGYVYPIEIKVPESVEPIEGFPICVLLHANGSNGRRIINQFSSVLDDHILIAPTGYLNSWNICDERSNAPDLEMVEELINNLSNYSNINLNKIF